MLWNGWDYFEWCPQCVTPTLTTGCKVQMEYTSLGISCHNVYTKSHCWLLMHMCSLVCAIADNVHCGRQYLNWCTPFWPYSQWKVYIWKQKNCWALGFNYFIYCVKQANNSSAYWLFLVALISQNKGSCFKTYRPVMGGLVIPKSQCQTECNPGIPISNGV